MTLSAGADVGAAVEEQRDVLLSLLAEVARNYVELRWLQQRLDLARRNLDVQNRELRLSQERFRQGLTNQLDVSRARAEVATTSAQIPALESNLSEAVHRLSILVNQRPTALSAELSTAPSASSTPPPLPPNVPVGLPSDLLRRRPDIRRAERQLAAATAQIGVATADLFPKFSLSGSFGFQARRLDLLGNWNDALWSFGPSATWAIFDAGRI